MTELERFLAVVRFEPPDYWPLLAAHALGSVHKGGLPKLHGEGMPQWVSDIESWCRYWGQCTYELASPIGIGAPGVRTESWVEGDFEFVRSETGALTRQVLNNEMVYSMPDFIEFDVRDRASWEAFRDRITPRAKADVEDQAGRLDGRTRPAAIGGGATWGRVRDWMGPRRALLAIHDEPELLREMIGFQQWLWDEFTLPVIQRYRPEVILWWEDFCYNHGMLISPGAFREFCAPFYRHAAAVARDCGAELLMVDCDGNVGHYLLLLEEVGFNGCCPMEQVCGNDLLAYRRRQGRMIFAGGIDKWVAASGNGHRIEAEILSKVPPMLGGFRSRSKRFGDPGGGGYFPAFDHGLPPQVGFRELCRAMTLLHEICGSEELGEFPRM